MKKSGLTARLLRSVMPVIAILLVLFSVSSVFYRVYKMQVALDKRANEAILVTAKIVEKPLMNFNVEVVAGALDALMHNQDIMAIVLYDEGGSFFAGTIRQDGTLIHMDKAPEISTNDRKRQLKHDVISGKQKIGHLELWITEEELDVAMFEAAIEEAAKGVALLVLILILLGVVVSFALRPLLKVSNRVLEVSDELGGAASRMVDAGAKLSGEMDSQSGSITHVMQMLSNVSTAIDQTLSTYTRAEQVANETKDITDKSQSSLKTMEESLKEVINSSREMAQIIKSIDEIAFQTNLLSLNAAVEAARAGDAGRGFSVVAEEVRALARRSAEASSNTSNLIVNSQDRTGKTLQMADGVEKSLEQVTMKANENNEIVVSLAEITTKHSKQIQETLEAMRSVEGANQINLSHAQSLMEISDILTTQVKALEAIMGSMSDITGITFEFHTDQGLELKELNHLE